MTDFLILGVLLRGVTAVYAYLTKTEVLGAKSTLVQYSL